MILTIQKNKKSQLFLYFYGYSTDFLIIKLLLTRVYLRRCRWDGDSSHCRSSDGFRDGSGHSDTNVHHFPRPLAQAWQVRRVFFEFNFNLSSGWESEIEREREIMHACLFWNDFFDKYTLCKKLNTFIHLNTHSYWHVLPKVMYIGTCLPQARQDCTVSNRNFSLERRLDKIVPNYRFFCLTVIAWLIWV